MAMIYQHYISRPPNLQYLQTTAVTFLSVSIVPRGDVPLKSGDTLIPGAERIRNTQHIQI